MIEEQTISLKNIQLFDIKSKLITRYKIETQPHSYIQVKEILTHTIYQ